MRVSHCSAHKLVGVSLVPEGIYQWGDYLRSTCNIEIQLNNLLIND